ncbi:conserved hypothetical protein [Arthrobacter sp. Hiyo6]|nr:conserved hypothetical protein [Arthrobacter sp. Hiyo6]
MSGANFSSVTHPTHMVGFIRTPAKGKRPIMRSQKSNSVPLLPWNLHLAIHLSQASSKQYWPDDKNDSATRILKFEAGTDTSAIGTLTHDFWEEVFIIEGSMTDKRLNRTFRAGDWAIKLQA